MIATVTNIGSASSPVHYFEQDGYLRKTAGMLPPSLQSGMQGICGPGLSGCLDQALALLHAVPKPHGERGINGETAERRLAVRRFLADLEDWARAERAGLSRHSPVVKAMDYMRCCIQHLM